MSAKVWVLGDAVVDLLPESDGRLLPCPGGAPANVAVGIARLGGTSGFIGRVSNYNNLANVGLGALQGQANAGQTYANNMSSIAQQSAALAAANANKPSSLQTAISGGTSGAIAGAGLASLLGTSTPWGAGIGAGIGLLGSLF
ncbi:DNA transfer protein [Escherichia coli]|nr:DNA transfer protein [Escherichia coli]EFA5308336.1 DNA transfer protein [Escherichia coli]EFB9702665.1 DNA transfer protein [Escherichia coli]EFO0539510.1 DNA transfer protein [Escherichia coli]EFO0820450.1 DNA transfer protein [Escherichia coli]